jgi:hypothetical protein
MPTRTGYPALLLIPFLLAACSSDHGLNRATRLLNDRLQVTMAPDIAAGAATVQPLSNGALVTLLGPSDFANTVDARADRRRDVRAGVVEALLDPSLVNVAVADTSTLPPYQRETRVRNMYQYFQDNGLALTLVPGGPPPAPVAGTPVPQGVAISITLDCPAHAQRGTWGYGPVLPSCH